MRPLLIDLYVLICEYSSEPNGRSQLIKGRHCSLRFIQFDFYPYC